MPSNIVDLHATELSRAIRNKQVSCTEVMQAYLSHINRHNPIYNALVNLVDEDQLMAQAKHADETLAQGRYWGWMHGMPHAVKELAEVAGIPFTEGSPIYQNRIGINDDPIVAKIRQQGAIFIGKTNTPEFGLGSQSYNPLFGVTASAYDPELTAGGSSGGAACGLATRMLPVADGSDMMGSLRNPGAFNNVIGFRPSANVIDLNNTGPDQPLSTKGPMGRNTRDLIQLLQTIALQPFPGVFSPVELKTIHIGWLGDLNHYLPMDPGILDLCEASLESAALAGVRIHSINLPFEASDLWESWTTLRHNRRLDRKEELFDDEAVRTLLKPEMTWEFEQALNITPEEMATARRIRNHWLSTLERLFVSFDFLALPSAQAFPFSKAIHWPTEVGGQKMDTYHRWMEVMIPASLGGLPVINLPVGFDEYGRPMGLQVIGPFGGDKKVLEFALAYEQITNHLQRRPTLVEMGSGQ